MALDPKLLERVRPELQPGETLLWVAVPEAKRQVLVGIFIALFAMPWILRQDFFSGERSSFIWGVFEIPDILLGIVLLLFPLLVYGYVKSTLYAITNWRILIIHEDWSKRVRSYNESAVKHIDRYERPDGGGDIVFLFKQGFVEVSDAHPVDNRVKFFGVPNVREVEDLLLKTFPGRV